MRRLTRRTVLRLTGVAACAPLLPAPSFAQQSAGSHGMTVIGELKYPRGFAHFDYADPEAPRGGRIVTQLPSWLYNQNPATFNTLNMWVRRGDGAAGMGLTATALMTGSSDEPGSVYGLAAREVEISDDGKSLRFHLDPDATFHDGSALTAEDVEFSLTTVRDKGHPNIGLDLRGIAEIAVEDEHTIMVRLKPETARSLPITVAAAVPIFPKAWWEGRDFEATLSEPPVGSGPYRVGSFSFGRYIEFERVADWWANDRPPMVGRYNFERIRYEYYRDRTASFEAFKKGEVTFREEFTSRVWAREYNFPAVRTGQVVRDEPPDGRMSGAQGWFINMRRPKFADPRVRLALVYAFDFEWTNKNIMFDSYQRTHSFFEKSELKAEGAPGPDELELLEPLRGKVPDEVFGEVFAPPVSDGSGRDRQMLQKASELFAEAGFERRPDGLYAPGGAPFTIEFLDDDPSFEPHHNAYIAGLALLGVRASYRIVDPAQFNDRLKRFDFDMTVSRFAGVLYPDEGIKTFFHSERAAEPGSYNLAGIADPAVDTLLERVIHAEDWNTFVTASRALDRVLRSLHFWIPQWNKPTHWLAYWDMFDKPSTKPLYDTGVLDTWWFDPEKAARIGRSG